MPHEEVPECKKCGSPLEEVRLSSVRVGMFCPGCTGVGTTAENIVRTLENVRLMTNLQEVLQLQVSIDNQPARDPEIVARLLNAKRRLRERVLHIIDADRNEQFLVDLASLCVRHEARWVHENYCLLVKLISQHEGLEIEDMIKDVALPMARGFAAALEGDDERKDSQTE